MNQQMVVIKREPAIVEIAEPVRFEPKRFGTVRIDEIVDIAAALYMLSEDPAQRSGIIALATALGVEAR